MTIRLADDFDRVPTNVNEWNSLAEILGVDFDQVDDLGVVAWRLYHEKKFRESASVFHALIVLDPENIELYRGFAMASSKDGDLAAAIDAVEKAVSLLKGRPDRDADSAQLLALLAGFMYRAGRKRRSVSIAEEALRLSPVDAPWRAKLERGLERAKEKISRQKVRWRGLDVEAMLEPRLSSLNNTSNTLAWALGYEDKALLTLFENGVRLLDAGHPKRALRIFEGLVRLDSTVPVFHSGLAIAYLKTGQKTKAAERLDAAVERARAVSNGSDLVADTLLRRALFNFQRKAFKRAKRDVREILALEATRVPETVLNQAKRLNTFYGDDTTPKVARATRGAR